MFLPCPPPAPPLAICLERSFVVASDITAGGSVMSQGPFVSLEGRGKRPTSGPSPAPRPILLSLGWGQRELLCALTLCAANRRRQREGQPEAVHSRARRLPRLGL